MSYLPISTRLFQFVTRPERGPHQHLKISAGDHRIEVTVSPQGNVWHVWIDGEKVR